MTALAGVDFSAGRRSHAYTSLPGRQMGQTVRHTMIETPPPAGAGTQPLAVNQTRE